MTTPVRREPSSRPGVDKWSAPINMWPLAFILLAAACQGVVGSGGGVAVAVGMATGIVGGAQAIKCNIDTQGIPVEDEHKVLAEFRKFDCSLGGGEQVTCLKEIKMVDNKKVVLRNCGTAEVKNNCTTVQDVTRCYCMEDYCNHTGVPSPSLSLMTLVVASLAGMVLL